MGWRLENAVYVELKRRYVSQAEDVYFYKHSPISREVDFVVCCQGKVLELIQVSYSVTDKHTFKREVEALLQVSNALNCDRLTLVSLDESKVIEQEGKTIKMVNAVDWLLGTDET